MLEEIVRIDVGKYIRKGFSKIISEKDIRRNFHRNIQEYIRKNIIRNNKKGGKLEQKI